jgi:hypothetical protein
MTADVRRAALFIEAGLRSFAPTLPTGGPRGTRQAGGPVHGRPA